MNRFQFSRGYRVAAIRVLIGLLACLLAIYAEISRPELINRLDEGLRDFVLQFSADKNPETRVVVIDINDTSIRELGPWPWPRSRIADLVEILLMDYDARAVGLDIVFPEAQAADVNGDLRLANLARYAPLALAQILDYPMRAVPLHQGLAVASTFLPAGIPAVAAHGYIGNHAGLMQARCVGNIGYQPDPDGVLRHIPLVSAFDQGRYLHLAASLVLCAAPPAPAETGQFVVVQQRRQALPPTREGWWRVPFRRALEAYTVIPAAALLRGEVEAERIQGRYVLVGSSSLSLGDRISIPLAPLASGVMVHAQSVSALLDVATGELAPARDGRPWLVLWSVLSIAFAMFWIARWPAWRSMLLLLVLAGVWAGLAFWGVQAQFEGSLTAPLWGYLFLLVFAIPHEWRQSQRQTQRITETLSHYVARPVLNELLRRGITYSLEPQLREVTVLIADMEGYTRNTSALELEAAAELTKGFLDCLTRPVLEQGGTLDRYTGDGLVAFWGAPLDCPDQADKAVSAALQMLTEVQRFNAQRQARGLEAVRVRIGIENGAALVGDLGTPFRSTYTAVGDCINFASRLEAAARELPTCLVIGASAQQKLKQHETYSVGTLQLRGTDTVIEIYSAPQARLDVAAPGALPESSVG